MESSQQDKIYLPDPSKTSDSDGEIWFKANVNHRLDLKYNRVWKEFTLYNNSLLPQWVVAFERDQLPITVEYLTGELTDFRNYVSNMIPKLMNCKIHSTSIHFNECEKKYLIVRFSYVKTRTKMWTRAKTKLSKLKQTQPSANNQQLSLLIYDKISKKKISIDVDEFDPLSHLPCRLIQDNRNVTRLYTGRRTLNLRLWNSISSIIKQGYKVVKEFVKSLMPRPVIRKEPISFVPESKSYITETFSEVSKHSELYIDKYSYTSVPYNYINTDHAYSLAKFSEMKTFYMARRYIICHLGIPGYGKRKFTRGPSFTNIEIASYLRSVGLPLDESLRELYLEYCISRDICDDAGKELLDYMLAETK